MGTYGLEGVMRAWELEKLTTEQAIGQILQLITEIEARLCDLERKYSRMNRLTSPSVPGPKAQDRDVEERVAEEGNETEEIVEEKKD
jgi:hypothetical protein